MTEQDFSLSYTGWQGTRETPAMADDLEQQIANCKRRIAVIGTLIEEQRAAGLITAEAERVLALEASYLKVLEDMLASGGTGVEC
jgi:hypothetical protein